MEQERNAKRKRDCPFDFDYCLSEEEEYSDETEESKINYHIAESMFRMLSEERFGGKYSHMWEHYRLMVNYWQSQLSYHLCLRYNLRPAGDTPATYSSSAVPL